MTQRTRGKQVESETDVQACVQSAVGKAWVVTARLAPGNTAWAPLPKLITDPVLFEGTELFPVPFPICPRCYSMELPAPRGCVCEPRGPHRHSSGDRVSFSVGCRSLAGADDRHCLQFSAPLSAPECAWRALLQEKREGHIQVSGVALEKEGKQTQTLEY